jgi:hypothetical protein
MPLDEHWDQLKSSDWEAFAHAWMAELRGVPESPDSDVGQSVVMMNFTAGPEHQWQFVRAAISQAESDEELGHIAAGPMEHLMGWHGADYIDAVEAQAASDPKFARMLAGVWKYMMNDEVWRRVQALKARYSGSCGPVADA